jgi:hypothetical protein
MKSHKYVLYIEGTTDDTNGDLRQGFSSLFSQKLEGKMPRIRMADGRSQAINKFKKPLPNDNPLLIIDLDKKDSYKTTFFQEENLIEQSAKIFFMVQEMEAWFLSQPTILDAFYNHEIGSKIKRKPSEIENPSDELIKLTKNIPKKEHYHKVRHGVELLKLLNLSNLMKEFDDVRNLIEFLIKE